MTREEVKQLLMVIDATYQNFKVTDHKTTLDAWYIILADYDYNPIAMALKTFITTDDSGFAPNIGKLVQMSNAMFQTEEEMTGLEAWSKVRKSISNSLYSSEEEFDKLPDVVRVAIGDSSQLKEWATMDTDVVNSVIQSNFLRSYKVAVERKRQNACMPLDVKKEIASATEKIALEV